MFEPPLLVLEAAAEQIGVRACAQIEPGSSCSAAAAQRNEERSWGADTRAHPISESKEKGGT